MISLLDLACLGHWPVVLPAGVVLVVSSVVAAWVGECVGGRVRARRAVFRDATCAACGAWLGWRQTPFLGRALGGCAACGARGPARHAWVEAVAAWAGILLLAPIPIALWPVALLGVAAVAGCAGYVLDGGRSGGEADAR